MSDSMHDDEVLLGASFLNEIEIEIDDDVMTLRQTWAEERCRKNREGVRMISWFSRSRIRKYMTLSKKKQDKVRMGLEERLSTQNELLDSAL